MLTVAQRAEFLSRQELLSSLPPDSVESLAKRTGEREVAAGEILFREGDAGDAIFFVIHGEIEVFTGDERNPVVLAVLDDHDVFGEMAVFTDGIRTTSARGRAAAQLLFLKEKAIKVLIQNRPDIAFGFFRLLTNRIRRMNDYVAALAGKRPVRARLTVIEGPDRGRSAALVGNHIEIGRSSGSLLDDSFRLSLGDSTPGVLHHHAEVVFEGGDFFLRDLGSSRGTFLNDEKIVGPMDVQPGDEIGIGVSRIRFELAAEPAPASPGR